MIENAWNEYRGWAKRSRDLQEASKRWTAWAMLFAVLAATLGAAAGQAGTGTWWSRVLAFAAAACAAVTPVLGQDILAVGREAGWIRARATAEAIKSECFRLAAHSGDYLGPGASELFRKRRDQAIEPATRAGLTPLADPTTADTRRPSDPLDAEWYLKQRLHEQKAYYADRQAENEIWARRLREAALAAAVLAAVLGAASGTLDLPWLAPWIGVLTTLGAMIVAYGLMERRQYLAASYGMMASALDRMDERFLEGQMSVADLVTATEDLLSGEHAAWLDRMIKTISAPPPVPKPQAVGNHS
jgi:hypothetical protein